MTHSLLLESSEQHSSDSSGSSSKSGDSSSSSSSRFLVIRTEPLPADRPRSAQEFASLLPSLVLVGRCCLDWAAALDTTDLNEGASSRGTIEGLQALARRGRALLADKILCSDLQGQIAAPSMLSAMLTTTIAFHSSQGVEDSNSYAAEQLSVYGLDFNVLRKAAQEALDARDAAAAATAGGDEKILMQAKLAQKLVAVGQALTAVPVRAACNNPRCSRLSGPTELSNLNAKCSACRVAYYCCASCQRSHWKQHKPVCKAIAEAAAAAAASAGSDVANI